MTMTTRRLSGWPLGVFGRRRVGIAVTEGLKPAGRDM